jgi:hypothetical protein
MTHDEEFAVFDLADFHNLSNEKGDLYGLRMDQHGRVTDLGTRGEQVAEFPGTRVGQQWHGYPAWPIMRLDREDNTRKYACPREVLAKMRDAGLINEKQRSRLARGK